MIYFERMHWPRELGGAVRHIATSLLGSSHIVSPRSHNFNSRHSVVIQRPQWRQPRGTPTLQPQLTESYAYLIIRALDRVRNEKNRSNTIGAIYPDWRKCQKRSPKSEFRACALAFDMPARLVQNYKQKRDDKVQGFCSKSNTKTSVATNFFEAFSYNISANVHYSQPGITYPNSFSFSHYNYNGHCKSRNGH